MYIPWVQIWIYPAQPMGKNSSSRSVDTGINGNRGRILRSSGRKLPWHGSEVLPELHFRNVSSFIPIPCSLIYGSFVFWMVLLQSKLSIEREESRRFMRSTKRVILANGPRLLREMLHRVIDKAEHLEVIREIGDDEALPETIKTLEPEWVIVAASFSDRSHHWTREFPAVGFVFVSPSDNLIKMKCPTAYEENYADLSLKDFIQILEKDLQPLDY